MSRLSSSPSHCNILFPFFKFCSNTGAGRIDRIQETGGGGELEEAKEADWLVGTELAGLQGIVALKERGTGWSVHRFRAGLGSAHGCCRILRNGTFQRHLRIASNEKTVNRLCHCGVTALQSNGNNYKSKEWYNLESLALEPGIDL
ncbi:hypothetical protein EDB86DRAFT_2836578 [Lactarius hatsudake]|nr:hypothetical protein EDB86DRAFT_2836578 [Lactarius hatsudake]